jgi:hypothetical protein
MVRASMEPWPPITSETELEHAVERLVAATVAAIERHKT